MIKKECLILVCFCLCYSARHLQTRSAKKNESFRSKLPSMAKCLDKLLYERAADLESYCNMATLGDRINEIMNEQLQKRSFISCKQDLSREQVLKELMTGPKYEMAFKLVREIKLHKLRRVANGKCGPLGSCERRLPSDNEDPGEDISARESLADPVANLFFNTPLLEIFERYPLHRLKEQNWNMLLVQAIQNLREYKAFLKQSRA